MIALNKKQAHQVIKGYNWVGNANSPIGPDFAKGILKEAYANDTHTCIEDIMVLLCPGIEYCYEIHVKNTEMGQ